MIRKFIINYFLFCAVNAQDDGIFEKHGDNFSQTHNNNFIKAGFIEEVKCVNLNIDTSFNYSTQYENFYISFIKCSLETGPFYLESKKNVYIKFIDCHEDFWKTKIDVYNEPNDQNEITLFFENCSPIPNEFMNNFEGKSITTNKK